MAATRIIPLHIGKGKTIETCLSERLDYSQNSDKTDGGELISSYECDPYTADEEFLLSKRKYEQSVGRKWRGDIIAYQIRQSFKPGEITAEEANKIGYETVTRLPFPLIQTGRTSTIISSSIPQRWTAAGNSGIFGFAVWRCNF